MDPVTPAAVDGPAEAAGPTTAGSTTRALAKAGIVVTAAFVLSRILGYARVMVIGAMVPVGPELDAFFAAFRIPDLLFQLVAAGALSSALIPVIAGLFASDQEARAWRVVSTVATLMLAALLVLAAIVLALAPQLVNIIAPGFDEAGSATTAELTRIMVLSPLFLAAGAVATSVLNAKSRFGAAALAPLVYNLVIIASAVLLVPSLGVTGLAIGVVAGAAGHVLVQLPALGRLGARIRPRLELGDAQARKVLLLMVPRAVGLGATQIVFLVMTSLASTLEAGSISVFSFAFAVLQIPIGVIGVPLGIVLLPSLSREAATGAVAGFRRLLVGGLSLLAWVMISVTALAMVTATDVVRLLFDHGAFDEAALERTATTLTVFLAGLTAHSLIAVIARAFYARQDTATPVGAALVAVVSNIVLGLLLIEPLGLAGLAAAIAVSAWIELSVLVVLLRRRVPGLGLGHVGVVMGRTLVAALAGGAAAFAFMEILVGAWGDDPGLVLLLSRLALVTAAGTGVIVVVSLALRIEEPRRIFGIVVDLLRRRGRA